MSPPDFPSLSDDYRRSLPQFLSFDRVDVRLAHGLSPSPSSTPAPLSSISRPISPWSASFAETSSSVMTSEHLHVSTDVGMIAIDAVTNDDLPFGQYYRAADTGSRRWRCWQTPSDAPHNIGGFHEAIIDTHQPGTTWLLLVKVSMYTDSDDPGGILSCERLYIIPEAGHSHYLLAGVKGIYLANTIHLTNGKVCIRGSEGETSSSDICTGLGDGYYPITIQRNLNNLVEYIQVDFF